jgi:hypothetical protein
MRRLISILACGCVLALAGCSDSHEKVMSDTVDVLSETNATLEGVTDKASAEAAKPKLEALSERMQALEARGEKLGEPSAAETEALGKKYLPQMMKEGFQLMAAMQRINSNPELREVLGSSVEGFGSGLGAESGPPGGLEFGNEAPEMPTEATEGFGTENPFGSAGDAPAFPAEPQQPAGDDQPE